MTTSTAASVRTGLMQRIVCRVCGHLHRLCIIDKCQCCRSDALRHPAHAQPTA